MTTFNKRRIKRLHKALTEGNVKVNFQKKDGSMREMLCTLDERLIPEDQKPIGPPKNETPMIERSACTVYDHEREDWRSFRWESIDKWKRTSTTT
jgi:hypothetical protein